MSEKEPIRITLSKEEMIQKASDWIKSTYTERDIVLRHTRLGMLVDFIGELFEPGGRDKE